MSFAFQISTKFSLTYIGREAAVTMIDALPALEFEDEIECGNK